jgi:serine/threonine-protein kinase
MVGATLGRYRLSARIAQGGMGEVYRGLDVGLGGVERPVAVKLIAPELARDPALRQQFVDEGRLSFVLCHQNVVQVRDAGEIDGHFFIAMEWVDGADLGTILHRLRAEANQPLPLRYACLVAVEAARGLDYAHRASDAAGRPLHLVHRDVSPSNLLVSFEGEIKVSDFGIARSRLREWASLPGVLKGKIGYMAPEQARGEPLDPRADVFALGAVLYEMLTGQNPFLHVEYRRRSASEEPAGVRDNEALARVRACQFAPVRTVVPTVPQGLEAIVLRAMAAAREQRYQSCAQMREDLEAFARRESYALSPSDFGQFVRDLWGTSPPVEAERVKTPSPVKRLSGARAVASPRAFNAALGGALAALGGSDDAPVETAPAAAQAVTVPGRPLRAATVAMPQAHQPVPLPDAVDAGLHGATDMTEAIPRAPTSALLLWGAGALALVGVAAASFLAMRPKAPAAAALAAAAPPAVSPPVAVAVAAVPSPVPPPAAGRLVAPPSPKSERHHARGGARASDAHLTILTDVAAEAFVDGQFVSSTPIVDLTLAPGRHVVRAVSIAPGLRLIPREQTVELRAGELKQLELGLK